MQIPKLHLEILTQVWSRVKRSALTNIPSISDADRLLAAWTLGNTALYSLENLKKSV